MVINGRPMFDPRMLNRLSGFFPSTVRIISRTNEPDSMGSPVNDDVVLYEDIPCVIAPFNDIIPISGERQLEQYTYDTTTHRITLKGYYPEVTAKMLAVTSTEPFVSYNILGVEHDSHSYTTRLIVNVVTI